MNKEIPKAYNAQDHEDRIYQMWESSGAFAPDPDPKKTPYVVMMPPPNATGQLHLGHATMLAVEDILVRTKRMQGFSTLYLPGTDHAAIATQSVVEKKLQDEGMPNPRESLGREGLLKEIQSFVETSKDSIRNQIRKMGTSCDWSRERYTFSDEMNLAVNELFRMMYEDGLIYRGGRIVNWDPKMQTTVADDELEYVNEKSKFYYFQYGPVVIGTARPETKFGDKVIVVHPEDSRYKDLIGKEFELEWIEGPIKARVIASEVMDMEMGTGAMTITPAHSLVDYELAQEFDLESPQIIDFEGKIREDVSKTCAGLSTQEAREKVVEILDKKGLLVKVDENYEHNIAVNYRGKGVVEPQIMKQWFVDVNKPAIDWKGKILSIKEVLQDVVKSEMIAIVPKRFDKIYFHWIDNLRDWCISRQIWWGHRIPIWYACDENDRVYVKHFAGEVIVNGSRLDQKKYLNENFENANMIQLHFLLKQGQINTNDGPIKIEGETLKEKIEFISKLISKKKLQLDLSNVNRFVAANSYQEACKELETEYLIQDFDTLDTWFSSGLWTFSTLGWPQKTADLERFTPSDVLETGYDILFFWVARMIIQSTYALRKSGFSEEKSIPFKNVYLHGLIRDIEGKKMSKSRPETCIDPLDMIEKYGTDSVRLSLMVGSTPGNDMRLSEDKIAGYRNFVNKIWNGARFVILNLDGEETLDPSQFSRSDKWILGRLNEIIENVTQNLETYQFSEAGLAIYNFFWGEYCDWYLEVSKVKKNPAVLRHVLKNSLILMHPFMPYVTESIWEALGEESMLMTQAWPQSKPEWDFPSESDEMSRVMEVIKAIRKCRAESNVDASKKIHGVIHAHEDLLLIQDKKEIIQRLANLGSLEIFETGEKLEKALSAFVGDIEIYIPLADLLDMEAEKTRLNKELKNIQNYLNGLEKKLSNEGFVKNAPESVIVEERKKLEEASLKLEKIEGQLEELGE